MYDSETGTGCHFDWCFAFTAQDEVIQMQGYFGPVFVHNSGGFSFQPSPGQSWCNGDLRWIRDNHFEMLNCRPGRFTKEVEKEVEGV